MRGQFGDHRLVVFLRGLQLDDRGLSLLVLGGDVAIVSEREAERPRAVSVENREVVGLVVAIRHYM